MKKKPNQTVAQIQRARREIDVAETELKKVIGAIAALPRAEKVTAEKVVADAFDTLKIAKEKMTALEKLLAAAAKD